MNKPLDLPATLLDSAEALGQVSRQWDGDIVRQLTEYIAIPAKSPGFDPQWQQHGYIEPCGCSPKQSGGLARRADLLRQLREVKKWPVLALESGGTLDESRVTRHQSILKFNMILDAFNSMGYRALGLGTEELKLTSVKLFEIFFGVQPRVAFRA